MTYEEAKDILCVSDANTNRNLLGVSRIKWRARKMEDGKYTAHEVAVILADSFGDDCACNFNGNDEWLPYLCELQEACPNPGGVACWEQYLKYRHCKNEMESK